MKTDKTLFDLRLRVQELEDGPFEYDRSVDGEYAPFVEYEVRKRIEARGWFWSVGQWRSGKTGLINLIACVADDPFDLRTKHGHTGVHSTPAAALLTAYIAALEANQ